MSESLATIPLPADKKASALARLASKLHADPDKLLATLKATVFKGATNEELLTLTVICNEYGLNPLLKEIYAFPAKGGGITPIVSIDGWLRMVNDHPQLNGLETEHSHDAGGNLISCTCRIFRKDRDMPAVATEYLAECQRNTEPWKMKHRMLRHKAIIQCARIAFGFSGIQDEDEGRETAMRQVAGRTVPTARRTPLPVFDNESIAESHDDGQDGRDDTAAQDVPSRNVSPSEQFWDATEAAGADMGDVFRFLLANDMMDEGAEFPGDLTDAEAKPLLLPDTFKAILAGAKGGAK